MSNASNFEFNNGVLEKYTGSDTEVTIPDSVIWHWRESIFALQQPYMHQNPCERCS